MHCRSQWLLPAPPRQAIDRRQSNKHLTHNLELLQAVVAATPSHQAEHKQTWNKSGEAWCHCYSVLA